MFSLRGKQQTDRKLIIKYKNLMCVCVHTHTERERYTNLDICHWTKSTLVQGHIYEVSIQD